MTIVEKKATASKWFYWVPTGLFLFAQIPAGFADLMRVKSAADILGQLGYSLYLLTILGVAKLLGGIAILYGRNQILKEWAYAGFTFDTLGAAASYCFAHDPFVKILMPLIVLALVLVSYWQWRAEQVSSALPRNSQPPRFRPSLGSL